MTITLSVVLWKEGRLRDVVRHISFKDSAVYMKYSVIFIVASYICMILHECGHYAADKILGLDNTQIHIGLLGGYVSWGTRTSRFISASEYQFVTLAGYAAMRIIAAFANWFEKKVHSHLWLSAFLVASYFVNRLSIVHGWQQGLFVPNDFSESAKAMAVWTDQPMLIIFILYGTVIAVDVYLSRRIIFANSIKLLRGLRLIS